MKQFNRTFLAVSIFTFGLCGGVQESKGAEPYALENFSPGQVWEYRTREGEEASRVVVGSVDPAHSAGPIVHVKIAGLEIENPNDFRGYTSSIPHAPISLEQFASSVTKKIGENGNLSGFKTKYRKWLRSVEQGEEPGIYSMPIRKS